MSAPFIKEVFLKYFQAKHTLLIINNVQAPASSWLALKGEIAFAVIVFKYNLAHVHFYLDLLGFYKQAYWKFKDTGKFQLIQLHSKTSKWK